ncbi:MAG TPA: DUF3192 domain-containing protein [Chlamydiales bacterium]|nr:DUF3192 domain-containing protein [Chlamydiales bacterium]
MCNSGLSSMSIAQENIWNLSRICLGMTHCKVRTIMHEPDKTQCFTHDGETYWVWFYITRPTALEQCCLLKKNVTPLVFREGVLIGWGFDVYDCLLKKKVTYEQMYHPESFERTMQELELSFLAQNEVVEEGCQCPICKPKKPPLTEEDDRMIEESNDQNFNFW